jgi:peroxiredoxin Q/BCP
MTEILIDTGVTAPDFTLESSDGTRVQLSEYRRRSSILIYFMREFSCLQCQAHVAELRRLFDQLRALNTTVLVIGGGSAKDAKRIAMMFRVPFHVLADPDRAVYRDYGLHKVLFAIQRSGTFLIDLDGQIVYVQRVTNPTASLDKVALLKAIESLQQPLAL